MKTVKEVSELTGVSVRALHHYDAIGLLPPTRLTEAGYRLYDDAALERMLAGLFDLGVRRAVITGVRLGPDRIGIVGADRETGERLRLETPYAPVSLPGTGDVFASAFCGKLAAGTPFAAAAEAALSFTYRCIRRTLPTDIRYGLCFEEELKSL